MKAILPSLAFFGGIFFFIWALNVALEMAYVKEWVDWKFSLIATPITFGYFILVSWLTMKAWDYAVEG